MSEATRTYGARIIHPVSAPLEAYASLMAQVKHKLFADFRKGKDVSSLKSSYLTQYGITARQFNALRVEVEGKIGSIKERQKQLIEEKKEQLASLKKKLPRIKNKEILHQKKKRFAKLQSQLEKLQTAQKEDRISL